MEIANPILPTHNTTIQSHMKVAPSGRVLLSHLGLNDEVHSLAPVKLVSFSDQMAQGQPRMEINRHKVWMNMSVPSELTSSYVSCLATEANDSARIYFRRTIATLHI